jgi:hypothetical protein
VHPVVLPQPAEREEFHVSIIWVVTDTPLTLPSAWQTVLWFICSFTKPNAHMRSALFRDVTQRRVVILCRRFGTTYRSDLQDRRKSTNKRLLDPWRRDRYVLPKRRRGVICQNSTDLINIVAESWDHGNAYML